MYPNLLAISVAVVIINVLLTFMLAHFSWHVFTQHLVMAHTSDANTLIEYNSRHVKRYMNTFTLRSIRNTFTFRSSQKYFYFRFTCVLELYEWQRTQPAERTTKLITRV